MSRRHYRPLAGYFASIKGRKVRSSRRGARTKKVLAAIKRIEEKQ